MSDIIVLSEKTALKVGESGVRLHDGPDLKQFILVGWDRSFRLLLGPSGLNCLSSFASDFQWCCLIDRGSPSVMQHIVSEESSSLLGFKSGICLSIAPVPVHCFSITSTGIT